MKSKGIRDRVSRPRNPADIRLNELRRQEEEEERWAAMAGPVTVRKIDPVKLHPNTNYIEKAINQS